MKQIKRYDISGYDIDISEWEKGDWCKYEDHKKIVKLLEKGNEKLKKYKKMWNELKDEVQWIADEMVYNSMIEKEKENWNDKTLHRG